MVPENIRCGVTITPPGGDPVTGTAYPVGAEFNNCNYGFYYDMFNVLKTNGTLPSGITITNYNNSGFKIGGSGIVTGYIGVAGVTNPRTSGDYVSVGNTEGAFTWFYIPPTQLTANGIQVSWDGNAILTAVAALTTVTSMGLSAENILNGVTINGVTGNYIGSSDLVMKILVRTNSDNEAQFWSSTGQSTPMNAAGKNVTGITTNKGRVFLLSNAVGNTIQQITNGGVGVNVSGTNIFNQEVTSLAIVQSNGENYANFGGLCLIYN